MSEVRLLQKNKNKINVLSTKDFIEAYGSSYSYKKIMKTEYYWEKIV